MKNTFLSLTILFAIFVSSCFSEQWMSFYSSDDGDYIREPNNIIEDSENNIWIGTGGYTGSYMFKFDGLHWTHYTAVHGLSLPPVYGFTFDDEDRLWALVGHPIYYNQNLCFFDGTEWNCMNIHEDGEFLGFVDIEYYDGSIILAEANNVYRFDTLGGLRIFDSTNRMRFSNELYVDPANNLWIDNYDEDRNHRISKYCPSWSRNYYLDCDENVLEIYLDSRDSLWVSTSGCGAYCISDSFIIHHDTSTILIASNLVSMSVTEDNYSNIWITEKSRPEYSITIISEIGIEHKTCNELSLCDCYPRQLYKDSFGNIWITGNNCITVYNPDTIVFLIEEEPTKPECFSLKTYPNPFNSVCNIEKPNNLTAEVLDIEGNLVEIINPKETYWKPKDHIPSGKYLIHVDDEDVSYRQSVIYLK